MINFKMVGTSIAHPIVGVSGASKVLMRPAKQGTGVIAGGAVRSVLEMAGIKDVYSRVSGKKRTTFNLVKACIDALKKTNVGEK